MPAAFSSVALKTTWLVSVWPTLGSAAHLSVRSQLGFSGQLHATARSEVGTSGSRKFILGGLALTSGATLVEEMPYLSYNFAFEIYFYVKFTSAKKHCFSHYLEKCRQLRQSFLQMARSRYWPGKFRVRCSRRSF